MCAWIAHKILCAWIAHKNASCNGPQCVGVSSSSTFLQCLHTGHCLYTLAKFLLVFLENMMHDTKLTKLHLLFSLNLKTWSIWGLFQLNYTFLISLATYCQAEGHFLRRALGKLLGCGSRQMSISSCSLSYTSLYRYTREGYKTELLLYRVFAWNKDWDVQSYNACRKMQYSGIAGAHSGGFYTRK